MGQSIKKSAETQTKPKATKGQIFPKNKG